MLSLSRCVDFSRRTVLVGLCYAIGFGPLPAVGSDTGARAAELSVPPDQALYTEFRYQTASGADGSLIVTEPAVGHMVYIPGGPILWHTLEPENSRLTIQNGIARQTIDGIEISRLPLSTLPGLATMVPLIRRAVEGKWQLIQQQFKVTFKQTQTGWMRHLEAKKKGGAAEVQYLSLKGARHLNELTATWGNGHRVEITFRNQRFLPAKDAAREFALDYPS